MTGLLAERPALASPLGRRNPTVKLGLLLAVSCTVLFVLDPVTPAVLYAVALVAVMATTRAPARTVALAHVPFVSFAAGLLAVNALSRPGEVVAALGPLAITDAGLAVGAALAGRTLVVGVLSIGFWVSTDPVALVTSLHQDARLGPRPTYALLAGYRMLEELPREWQTIRQAQQVRRAVSGRGSGELRAWWRAAFGLLVVSVRKGERVSFGLECRGLGLTPRTTWRRPPLQRADAVMVVVVVAAVGGVLAASAWAGVLRGVSALGG